MNEAELKRQPQSVRDEFEKITDAQVDDDVKIVEWQAELDAALANLRAANEQHDRVRSVLGSLQSKIDEARNGMEQIDSQRGEAIAASLIAGGDFAEDDEFLARRLELERLAERLSLARPALERNQRQKNRTLELAANPCAALKERINQRRDELKLREALRRHGLS